MNEVIRKSKRRLVASFLCLLAVCLIPFAGEAATKKNSKKSTKTAQVSNTFEKPDFAFPKTVGANAGKRLESALSAGSYGEAILAAIQIDVSEGLVDKLSYSSSIERFDSLAKVVPAPWNGVAILLEAQLVSDIYSSDRWRFDGRHLPANPVPDDMLEWDRDLFRIKVNGLVSEALRLSATCGDRPLSDISLVLRDYQQAVKTGFTIGDFFTLKAVELLDRFESESMRPLPFGDQVKPKDASGNTVSVSTLIDTAIARHAGDPDKNILAYFYLQKLSRVPYEERRAFLDKCRDVFTDSPYFAPFLTDMCDLPKPEGMEENDWRRNKLRLLDDYIARYPEAEGINQVKNTRARLVNPEVDMEYKDQVLPGHEFSVKVSGSNLYDFFILVISLPTHSLNQDYKAGDLAKGNIVASVPVNIRGSVPDSYEETINLPPLKAGTYAVVASTTSNLQGLLDKNVNRYLSVLSVSNLASFTLKENGERCALYVVSGVNQQPGKDATVKLYTYSRGNKVLFGEFSSDENGKVTFPPNSYYYEISKGEDRLYGDIYHGRGNEVNKKISRANVLTDLSVYRPGSKLRGSVILFSDHDHLLEALPYHDVRIILNDANWQPVDTLSVKSDEFGRAVFSFDIPNRGLLGSWNIGIESDGKRIGSSSIQVSEYKMPTFLVDVKSAYEAFKVGDVLTFRGTVLTYSGMPVAGGKVAYKVESIPSWWRMYDAGGSYGGETETSQDGSFEISIPTAAAENTSYARGSYRLSVTVTDAAGETQQANPVTFSLGEGLNIHPSLPTMYDAAQKNPSFSVAVQNLAGEAVEKTVYFRISAGNGPVSKGSFLSPRFNPDFSAIHSGKYEILFSLDPEFKDSEVCKNRKESMVLWRESDSRPPVPSVVWAPRAQITVPAGAAGIEVRVGTTYPDSYILATVSDSKQFTRSEWVKVSDGFASIKVDAPADNERIFISFKGLRNLDPVEKIVTLIPLFQQKKLVVRTETFRDNIVPGSKEVWKFSFDLDGKKVGPIPVMAVMTDKAINAISPFAWNFDPYSSLYWRSPVRVSWNNIGNASYNYYGKINYLSSGDDMTIPVWQTYGYSLYPGSGIMVRGMRMMKSAAICTTGSDNFVVNESMVVNESKEEEDGLVVEEAPAMFSSANQMADMAKKESSPTESEADMGAGGGDSSQKDELQLRQIVMPVAFFMPSLVSDEHGNVEVSFTAPDFTGTWQFQIAGYTSDMRGVVFTHNSLSSKPLMIKMNAPRFVRSADVLTIAATVFNNSDKAADVSARIEVIDAMTGESISEHTETLSSLEAGKSEIVNCSFKVPGDTESIIIKVMAEAGDYKDGEQTLVPVLPASTLVRESDPFYIASEAKDFSTRIPALDKDANVTLMYCDNPVWECVTALPSLVTPDSSSITELADALFGNAVAAGLFGKYPALSDYMKVLSNSSSVAGVSPLESNEDLKNVELVNTPWVNNAASETMRIRSLSKYANKATCQKLISDIVSELQTRQNPDGGWSWCQNMKTSSFMTGRVLQVCASMKNLGFLPPEAEKLMPKAFGYMDKQYMEDWKRSNRKFYPRSELLNYLWAKSRFGHMGSKNGFAVLDGIMMRDIRADWKKYSISDKATAAMLLNARGESALARTILESLGQYASRSEQKGMWFANLESDWSSLPVLRTTARVLEAFALIEPENPAIDKLRQWIVLSKQTQDWKGSSEAAEAVAAILSSGADWVSYNGKPEISLGGEKIELPENYGGTGSFVINLIPEQASGKELLIRRSDNGPAWGGVMAAYQAPIKDVKPLSVPQLSIRKDVYIISQDGSQEKVSDRDLKVGDRVRITFTIVNDRNLDYVTLTDPRAACMEPDRQISGYTSSDGIGMYKEIRDASVNLFMPYLPKGTHVISYDCFIDRAGEYVSGVAATQSQYAPLVTASSAARIIIVR